MTSYQRGSRGLEVTRLEIALQEMRLYTGPLDDIFGGGLEAAVRAFQQRKGLEPTGVADEVTRAMIYAEPSPRMAAVQDQAPEYRSLALTAGFESGMRPPECFSAVAGDFDGQGVSFGVLQWNLGQGTLQPLLRRLIAGHGEAVREAFEDGYDELEEVLTKDRSAQLAWARAIQAAGGRTLVQPWRSRFQALGRTAACQAAQVRAAEKLFARASDLCRDYGLWSERGLALMFDIVVQNGSIREATRQQILTEFESIEADASPAAQEAARMRIIADRRAEAARPRFIEDVRRRKLTIADGVGIVHGLGYDLERQFLLRLLPYIGASGEPRAPLPTPSVG